MSIRNLSFLTAVLLAISLSIAPFAGHAQQQNNAGAAIAQAQTGQQANLNASQPEKEAPADAAIILYRVMGVVLVVWIGLAIYLFTIDRKLTRLEKEARGRK